MAQDLAIAYRELYRAKFRAEVLAGTRVPFLVPLHLLGLWILPTLYLAIPHKNRPWLYQARWLVLAAVVGFNLHMICNVSSHNFGTAYFTGLIAAWGIIWNLALLVWTRPQWEAKRVDIRKTRKQDDTNDGQYEKPGNSIPVAVSGNGHTTKSTRGQQSSRGPYSESDTDSAEENSGEETDFTRASGVESDEHATNGVEAVNGVKGRQKRNTKADLPASPPETPEELGNDGGDSMSTLQKYVKYIPAEEYDLQKMAARSREFEYYWQEYPEDASFLVRLDWAFDIVSTFRMTGKVPLTTSQSE